MKSNSHSGHGIRVRFTSDDIRLLVCILSRNATSIMQRFEGRSERVNALAETCSRTGLSVVFLRAVKDSPLRAMLTADRLEALETGYRLQEERQKTLGQALRDLSRRFENAGQPFILLKGPYLASRFYGDVLGREFVDIDLLIPRADRRSVF